MEVGMNKVFVVLLASFFSLNAIRGLIIGITAKFPHKGQSYP